MSNGGEIREKQGPHFKISKDHERGMAQYLKEAWSNGDPRTKDNFSLEIPHFLHTYGLENKFKTGFPGTYINRAPLTINARAHGNNFHEAK